MSAWKSILVAALMPIVGQHAAVAEDLAPAPPSVEKIVVSLGSPVRMEALETMLDELRPLDVEAGLRLARALGRSGGHAALAGLRELLAHDDVGVRTTALRAVGQIALRAERVTQVVRRGLRARDDGERHAAIRALGAVGDARDVPHLLSLIETEETDAGDRAAAYEALSRLGGVSIPDIPARWRAWWRSLSVPGRADLNRCLFALDGLGEDQDPTVLREVVTRLGWLDVPGVVAYLREWLTQMRPELRREACHVVTALRLADLREDVRWVRPMDALGVYGAAAEEALRVLGDGPTK